jgi:hypothetical protein
MTPVETSSIVFAFAFGGALAGMFLGAALPENHLSPDSKSLVNLGMGVIGTIAALVLGLLVASAKASYDKQSDELTEVSANVVLLDRALSLYGSETKEARNLLRNSVVWALERTWPKERSQSLQPAPPTGEIGDLYEKIQGLSPQNESQRFIKSQALMTVVALAHTRWLMTEQRSVSISKPLLAIMVFWLTINFISFGLFAPRNATVIATLFLCALAVAGAIFLILEMYMPYQGMIQISSAPLRDALAHLGH